MSCDCSFSNGQETADKVRMKGISNMELPKSYNIDCECGETFEMKTFESKCPSCNMVYAVTPCSADNPKNIKSAGKNY